MTDLRDICNMLTKQTKAITDMNNDIRHSLQDQKVAIQEQTSAILEQTKALNRIADILSQLAGNDTPNSDLSSLFK